MQECFSVVTSGNQEQNRGYSDIIDLLGILKWGWLWGVFGEVGLGGIKKKFSRGRGLTSS